jgi:DNA-binding winged helix-turn-helix (wHTH) protein
MAAGLHFGDATLDPHARQLWRAGTDVHLSPKAFDLLLLLIERRPNAVGKDEIRKRLWPDTFVSDANLPSLIAEIREALKDDAREQKIVRTLHGFGYAFGAAVRETARETDRPAAYLVADKCRVALLAGETVIGRDGDGVTVVESSTVSRRHARIIIEAGRAQIEDLASKNGTYVNDVRLARPNALTDGDRVRFGSLLFTFRRASAASSTQTHSSGADR